jgi:hypothetical protein
MNRPETIVTTPRTCTDQRSEDFKDPRAGQNYRAKTESKDLVMIEDEDVLISPQNRRFT